MFNILNRSLTTWDAALILFKSKLGAKLADKLGECWDDPLTKCVDKAKTTLDLILQYQQSNPDDQAAMLTADINGLLPATSIEGGLLLYNQMCFVQKCLSRLDKKI